MILKILDIKDNHYYLEDKNGKAFNHCFKFFDLPQNPSIGDCINIKDELMDNKYKEYNDLYLFGPLSQVYGRNVKNEEDIDVISLQINGKTFYLKRFFG